MKQDSGFRKAGTRQSVHGRTQMAQRKDLVICPSEISLPSEIMPEQFARLPHRIKQRVLRQLPCSEGGCLLDKIHGHEYEGFIHGLIPKYCKWSYLAAGGEPEAIVEAGRAGRLYGMERIAADPRNLYTSGSTLIAGEGIVLFVRAERSSVIRQGWEVKQGQELRHPSVSLDDSIFTEDGEEHYVYEIVADPSTSGDSVEEMLQMEALQAALSNLSPDTRTIVLEVLSGKELRTMALERGQGYRAVQNRVWRAMNQLREELRRGEEPGFDQEAAMADGYRRLLDKIFEDVPLDKGDNIGGRYLL